MNKIDKYKIKPKKTLQQVRRKKNEKLNSVFPFGIKSQLFVYYYVFDFIDKPMCDHGKIFFANQILNIYYYLSIN